MHQREAVAANDHGAVRKGRRRGVYFSPSVDGFVRCTAVDSKGNRFMEVEMPGTVFTEAVAAWMRRELDRHDPVRQIPLALLR